MSTEAVGTSGASTTTGTTEYTDSSDSNGLDELTNILNTALASRYSSTGNGSSGEETTDADPMTYSFDSTTKTDISGTDLGTVTDTAVQQELIDSGLVTQDADGTLTVANGVSSTQGTITSNGTNYDVSIYSDTGGNALLAGDFNGDGAITADEMFDVSLDGDQVVLKDKPGANGTVVATSSDAVQNEDGTITGTITAPSTSTYTDPVVSTSGISYSFDTSTAQTAAAGTVLDPDIWNDTALNDELVASGLVNQSADGTLTVASDVTITSGTISATDENGNSTKYNANLVTDAAGNGVMAGDFNGDGKITSDELFDVSLEDGQVVFRDTAAAEGTVVAVSGDAVQNGNTVTGTITTPPTTSTPGISYSFDASTSETVPAGTVLDPAIWNNNEVNDELVASGLVNESADGTLTVASDVTLTKGTISATDENGNSTEYDVTVATDTAGNGLMIGDFTGDDAIIADEVFEVSLENGQIVFKDTAAANGTVVAVSGDAVQNGNTITGTITAPTTTSTPGISYSFDSSTAQTIPAGTVLDPAIATNTAVNDELVASGLINKSADGTLTVASDVTLTKGTISATDENGNSTNYNVTVATDTAGNGVLGGDFNGDGAITADEVFDVSLEDGQVVFRDTAAAEGTVVAVSGDVVQNGSITTGTITAPTTTSSAITYSFDFNNYTTIPAGTTVDGTGVDPAVTQELINNGITSVNPFSSLIDALSYGMDQATIDSMRATLNADDLVISEDLYMVNGTITSNGTDYPVSIVYNASGDAIMAGDFDGDGAISPEEMFSVEVDPVTKKVTFLDDEAGNVIASSTDAVDNNGVVTGSIS